MSTEAESGVAIDDPGFPELTALGKRIEMLRIERGLSKQHLARKAGTSRQQLWRVLTGKSELTTSLCARLAEALNVDQRALRAAASPNGNMRLYPGHGANDPALRPALADFFAAREALAATVRTLPSGAVGDLLAEAMQAALEHAASAAQTRVPPEILDLFRRVNH